MTGVQTCALPICAAGLQVRERDPDAVVLDHGLATDTAAGSSSEDDAYYAQFQVPDDLMW